MKPGPVCIMQLVLLVLCGVFSVTVTSLEEINITALRKEAEEGKASARLLWLKEREGALTVAYRFWSILIYFCIGAMSALYLPVVYQSAGGAAVAALVVITAFASVVLGRLAPLRIAAKNADAIAAKTVGLMNVFYILSYPFSVTATWLAKLCAALFGISPDEELEDVTEEEIRMMVDIGTESGAIAPEEQELIKNIFEFDNMSAANVMTHRTDVAVLKREDDPREWEKTVRDSGFSRFPVCGRTIDDIVGVVHARELYEFLYDGNGDVHSIIRPAYIVPETVATDILFRNMQQEKSHMAIVVDEYGGFSGIVTTDDLLEELVGQITDEKEELIEDDPIVRLDESTWEIDGTAPLDDVAAAVGLELPTDEYDTIGGLIFAQMDKIPEDGAAFEVEAYGLAMKVVKIEDRRIEKVLVCVAEPAKELKADEDEE